METETANPIIPPQEAIIQEEPVLQNAEVPINNSSAPQDNKGEAPPEGSPLECNICYEESDEPVTTTCGHIYCWACIYKWIQLKSNHNHCPVCKNPLAQEKLIPLYPKNYLKEKTNDAVTDGVPKRPYAKREGPQPYRGFGSSFFTGINIHMPNFAMTIGCLPTLIPIVLMILLNIFACLFDESDSDYEPSTEDYVRDPSGFDHVEYGEYETDAFDWSIIAIMVLFISLPFILSYFGRRRRNNMNYH